MAIREQGYRHWEGTYTGHAWRWWTVARAGVTAVVASRVRLALLLSLVAVAWIYPVVWLFILSLQGGSGFGSGLFYDYLTQWQWLHAIVMAAVVGSGLISNDLRTNALHIYLSRPLRRGDYLVGKAAVIFVWVSAVTLVPSLLLYVGGLLTTNDLTRPSRPLEILGEVLLVELLVVVTLSSLILAISAFSTRWTIALVTWIGFHFLLDLVAGIARGTSGHAEWSLLSVRANVFNVANETYGRTIPDPAWGLSLLVLAGLVLAALAAYAFRIGLLEVAE